MVATIVIAATLVSSPAKHDADAKLASASVRVSERLAVDLHPMTDDEKRIYPGRERWDKTEWYEAQFKSAKIVTAPEHVDEWNNGGLEVA